MLAIRMQRTGRKGHAKFRMIVQDARRTPTSGNIIALLGSYDPHTKELNIETEKASFYLSNGAQPSDRVVSLLKREGVKIPSWVKEPTKKTRAIKNLDKLRANRPEEPKVEEPKVEEAVPAEEPEAEQPAVEEASSEPTEAEEEPVAEPIEEAPEDDKPAEAKVEEATPVPVEESTASEAVEPDAAAEEPEKPEAEEASKSE
jgi:small subunit ribosomal protein S16